MQLSYLLSKGLTYAEYRQKLEHYVADTQPETLPDDVREKFEFTKLNLTRMARIDKTYHPSAEIQSLIKSIQTPQYWMVLTEGWCGDSAQNLPYVAALAALNPAITLFLIERDAHLEIMDAYLTDGKRSIPKLVGMDSEGNNLFTWGSRPAEAQALVRSAIANGQMKPEWEPKLHLWYARDKGKTLEKEIMALLSC